jgi:2-polyprenyl-6-methoxyphenol hydroxylase-like FAD-dependent oxidoreductase
MSTNNTITTDVLIVGGGPGGALLGNLLARRGVRVTLAEKEMEMARSFRGETIAARSVLTLNQLGFGPALKQHGYLELSGIALWENGRRIVHADYRRFPIDAVPIDLPQPALLGAFLDGARAFPNFTLAAGAAFTGLIEDDAGVVRGATLKHKDGKLTQVSARLVVGADGRFSKVRKASALPVTVTPMERDFLWFKVPRPADWGHDSQLVVHKDKHLVILPTFPDLLRIGYNLPKHGFTEIRKRGFEAFIAGIIELDPRLAPMLKTHVRSWDDTSFLEIFTAEMDRWARDGLVLIGDAAHTATPILGQGVNLAIQDAVFLAPVVAASLADHPAGEVVTAAELAGFVAQRRAHKAMVTRFQRLQETSLAQHTPMKTWIRRARLKALDLFPLKYRLLDKAMNAPHDMVVDRTAAAAVREVAAAA